MRNNLSTWGWKLSNMTMSAPAPAASRPSSAERHSTSILLLKLHTERAAFTACRAKRLKLNLRAVRLSSIFSIKYNTYIYIHVDCPFNHLTVHMYRQRLTSVILPDAQMWLSFSITIPLKSCLCMDTPPASMAYFSTNRKPGVVLRVPATSPCQPLAFAISWSWEQRLVIPEARARQLRAGLSPRRRHLAGPLTTAVTTTPSGPVEVT